MPEVFKSMLLFQAFLGFIFSFRYVTLKYSESNQKQFQL